MRKPKKNTYKTTLYRGLLIRALNNIDPIPMNKLFALLLLSAGLSLTACNKKTETIETIPARLELAWEQEVKRENLSESQTTLSPEMAQQLSQISGFHLSSSIIYADEKTKVAFKLVFSKEIGLDDMKTVTPILKSIFKETTFKATFHGPQKKHIIRERTGLFSHTESVVKDGHISLTGTMPGQTPSPK